MGNAHCSQNAGRRHSLVREEFVFSELDFDSDCDWEVYYVEIELKPLPSHAHSTTHICVDDYTQEILSEEEVCHCACASTGDTGRGYSRREGNPDDFCVQWDVNIQKQCTLDSGHTGRDHRHTETRRSTRSEEQFSSNDLEGIREQEYSHDDSPCDDQDLAEAVLPPCSVTVKPVSQGKRKAKKESSCPRNIVGDTRPKRELLRSVTSTISSSWDEKRNTGDLTSRLWTESRRGTTSSRTNSNIPDSEGYGNRYHTRRQSCPIPVPLKTPLSLRRRKFSLKGEPGWIPNPLDSDSDHSDFEDSGVFSDCTGSPGSAISPAHYAASAPRAIPKRVTERRRCNSEPMSRRSTPSSSAGHSDTSAALDLSKSGSASETKTRTRRGSNWGLLRLSRKRNKTKKVEKADDTMQADDTPEDEDDLSEQLKWLTMSDSQISPDTESSSEQAEDPGASESAPNTDTVCSTPAEARDPGSEEAADSRRVSRFDGELELDWLCEPEWNNLELELFWSVLRPHLEHLLQPEDSELLPEPCGALCHMDAADPKMLDRCLLHVQWHIWKGSYRQAVADFRATRRHFLSCTQSQLIESGTRDDVENLRLIFQRKRPSRFRLWI